MRCLLRFWKDETVLAAAMFLAVISAFAVKPGLGYFRYPDYRTLSLLFCLMCVVAGVQSVGMFDRLGAYLLKGIQNTRQLKLTLVGLCFFSSMAITNDVALITFVPFSILLFQMAGKEHQLMRLIVMETVAANLGSMLTPVGNPQNLYLYSVSGMGMWDFFVTVLPYAFLSFLLLFTIVWREKAENVEIHEELAKESREQRKRYLTHLGIFGVLFLCCLFTVFHLIPYQITLALVMAVVLVVERRIYRQVDYGLLMTFLCFFIFIGNMKQIPWIHDWLRNMIQGRELLAGIAASQIISNVPAAILLSGFTDRFATLLVAVNLGGLGTLIASMASLISYKYYAKSQDADRGRYIKCFTFWNLIFLAILMAAAYLLAV